MMAIYTYHAYIHIYVIPTSTGIYSINVDYTQQKVTVWGICNKYDVLQMMRNKRKEARFWNNPEDNVVLPDQNDEKLTLALSKDHKQSLVARSRSWKAWKKLVFTRSKSF